VILLANAPSRFPIRHSFYLDTETSDHCKELAERMGLSVGGVMRLLIKQAWEAQHEVIAAQHAAMRAAAHP
jgi:hypothetical protein